MDEADDIRLRMKISKLEAKLELFEIERSALLREITSSLTTQDRREEAFLKRDELATQSVEIAKELRSLVH